MKTTVRRWGTAALLYVAGVAIAAEPGWAPAMTDATADDSQQSVELQAETNVFQTIELTPVADDDGSETGENRLVGSSSKAAKDMWERLTDPDQRVAVRAEQRAALQESYADVEEVLGIDAATRDKLLDLLTDHMLAGLDAFHRGAKQRQPEDAQVRADETTAHLNALRELLGQEGLDRFEGYSQTLGERRQVSMLDARLGPGDKLQRAQKEQLILAFQEQTERNREQIRASALFDSAPLQILTPAEMQRSAQLRTIEANEANLRRMPDDDRRLAERAAAFLTPAQLQALATMNAEKVNSLRQWVQQARAQAGLDPTIPDRPQPSSMAKPRRVPIVGPVKVDFTVTVNRNEPVRFSHVGANGEPVAFEAGDGLFVEAIPTLYDDHWLDVKTVYYEQDSAGNRRRIGDGGYGTLTRMPDGTISGGGGGGGVIVGSRGYSITETATAAAL